MKPMRLTLALLASVILSGLIAAGAGLASRQQDAPREFGSEFGSAKGARQAWRYDHTVPDAPRAVHFAFSFSTQSEVDQAVALLTQNGYRVDAQPDYVVVASVMLDSRQALSAAERKAGELARSLGGDYLGYGGLVSKPFTDE